MPKSDPSPLPPAPAQSMPVFIADAFRAVDGANSGDSLSFASELVLDDAYALAADAKPCAILVEAHADGSYTLAADTPLGQPGAPLHLDAVLTLMSLTSQTTDAIVLVETDSADAVAAVYLLPMAALAPQQPYTLVGIDTKAPATLLAQLACARFARGTHITLASGEQRRIEALRVGDRVLTRHDGPRPIRWIGQSTVRAEGDFAPIRIRAGTLNNTHDLIVSPDHRLFIYQRTDRLGAGRADLLVRARHLVNGDTVQVQEGGFVDYFQLLFDHHQIVYAEGIAAESMLIDSRTQRAVPDDVTRQFAADIAAHGASALTGLDVQENLLDRPDAAEILRRASTR